jgi:hypothetical protein
MRGTLGQGFANMPTSKSTSVRTHKKLACYWLLTGICRRFIEKVDQSFELLIPPCSVWQSTQQQPL